MSVTVVSCLYGKRGYERFIPEWRLSIADLTTRPTEVIVGCDKTVADRGYHIPGVIAVTTDCTWRHPQAFYLQQAIEAAKTEWVWILDLDDTAKPDALDGLEAVTEDAWIVGYECSDGRLYWPPKLTAEQYLTRNGNPFPAGSMIRTESFRRAGGFPDVAFQDYGLWRRMALAGMTFRSSDRVHYNYRMHPRNRTTVELDPVPRRLHLAEMLDAEGHLVH